MAGLKGVETITGVPSQKGLWRSQTTAVRTVKGSQGAITGWFVYNPNTSAAFLQFFDTTGAVTLGTTVPDLSIGLPAGTSANLLGDSGIFFNTGIKFACATSEDGNGAPSSGLTVNLFWQ